MDKVSRDIETKINYQLSDGKLKLTIQIHLFKKNYISL